MVLLIGEREYSRRCTLDHLAEHTELIQSSQSFASTEELTQPSEEIAKTVFVTQREFAVLTADDPHGLHLIGSDDATTCHILVLDNPTAVALIHLDGHKTRESIEQICNELRQCSPQNSTYDAYIVGGFLDQSNKQYSRTLSNEILSTLAAISHITFQLKLAAITLYNDTIINNIHYPMIYGICFDVRTKYIRKMTFTDRGPAYRLRAIRCSSGDNCASCVYTSVRGSITIDRFDIDPDIVQRYYQRLYQYHFHDDKLLLKTLSTSPEQERASFLVDMKKNIVYILMYHEKLSEWFDSKTRTLVYRRMNDSWICDAAIVEDVEL